MISIYFTLRGTCCVICEKQNKMQPLNFIKRVFLLLQLHVAGDLPHFYCVAKLIAANKKVGKHCDESPGCVCGSLGDLSHAFLIILSQVHLFYICVYLGCFYPTTDSKKPYENTQTAAHRQS